MRQIFFDFIFRQIACRDVTTQHNKSGASSSLLYMEVLGSFNPPSCDQSGMQSNGQGAICVATDFNQEQSAQRSPVLWQFASRYRLMALGVGSRQCFMDKADRISSSRFLELALGRKFLSEKLSPKEEQIADSCARDAFITRSIPLVAVLAGATYAAAQKGLIKPGQYGLVPHMMAAVVLGHIGGQCESQHSRTHFN
jgi:hypothetical protein